MTTPTPPPDYKERTRARTFAPEAKSSVKLRSYIAAAALSLLFCGIAYKAYGVQITQGDRFREAAIRQHASTVEVAAPRGNILDQRGRPFAVSANADSVFAVPRDISDVTATSETLAELLGLDVRVLEARLATDRHFAWIKRHVSSADAAAVRAAKIKGVQITGEPRRFYPGGALAGPVLGFAGLDGKGLDGFELYQDDLLTGRRASIEALRDASGKVSYADGIVESTPGATITLTLDQSIQFIAEKTLTETCETHKAKSGIILVLDVETSGVLAMANYPSYDPNAPTAKTRADTRNRVLTDAFEIGSVMKVFSIAAAIDAGVTRPDEMFDVERGSYRVGRKVIRDTHHDWELTTAGILKRSSNVGTVKIAQRLGKDRLYEALQRFGFGQTTGVELPGERTGILRSTKSWGEIGLATISFGYGLTVTPIQVGAALAAIGNGGIYNEPRIIHRVTDHLDKVIYEHRPIGRRVLAEKTANAMLPILASVFEKGKDGGTAASIKVEGYLAGGKTGTAHKVDPTTHKYSENKYLSSFAGLAPIDAPRIAVVVVIDEPGGEVYYGAKVAGPAFGVVVSETLRYLGVPSLVPIEDPNAKSATEAANAKAKKSTAAAKQAADNDSDSDDAPPAPVADDDLGGAEGEQGSFEVPDFRGMGRAKVLETARQHGLTIESVGRGRAISQEPPPGPSGRSECRVVFASGDKGASNQTGSE